jgi:hypothetical protein
MWEKAMGFAELNPSYACRHSNGQSQTSRKAIVATNAAKTAYDEVKIANAVAGHLALFSRQTIYATLLSHLA